ncbi:MAG: hypothetical protein Q7T51_03115 [Candidatus Moranbacteria bacterium]|nr:hypothetical protein [Candidatus Moranbacteria bacterium]
MKKLSVVSILAMALALVGMIASSALADGADILPWSYPNGQEGQTFAFGISQKISNPQIRINVGGGNRKSVSAVTLDEDNWAEVSILKEGAYNIRVTVKGEEQLTQNLSRSVHVHIEYPVKVGKVYFRDHYRMHLANGNIGYTFMVYPQFGYEMPDRIDAEVTFGDVIKEVSFSCGQNYIRNQGYCETNIVELTPSEYVEVLGETYTCLKTDETESCQNIRFVNFQ